MLTSILVGLDGSSYSDVALDLGIGIEWAKSRRVASGTGHR